MAITVERVCEYTPCGRTFHALAWIARNGGARFCTHGCHASSRRTTLSEKLARRTVRLSSGCWELYRGNRAGYAWLKSGGSKIAAHVLAWQEANGRTVPTGLVVMHSCDNPRCVNPEHLSVGTHRDNVLDAVRKGRNNTFGRQKLNAEQVMQIRALVKQGMRQKLVAAQFGVTPNNISCIVRRVSWGHLDGSLDGLECPNEPACEFQRNHVTR